VKLQERGCQHCHEHASNVMFKDDAPDHARQQNQQNIKLHCYLEIM